MGLPHITFISTFAISLQRVLLLWGAVLKNFPVGINQAMLARVVYADGEMSSKTGPDDGGGGEGKRFL